MVMLVMVRGTACTLDKVKLWDALGVNSATLPKLYEVGVRVTDLGAAFTFSETVVEFTKAPLVPVMVSVYVPAGVLYAVVTLRVEVCAPLVMTTVFGVKVPVAPEGKPDTLMVTFPVKPLVGVTVAV